MEEFLVEHWQLITSLVASLLNFLFALLIHKRSSRKISKLAATETDVDDALYEVSEKLHRLVSSILEDLKDGKESAKEKIAADVPQIPEEESR